VFRYITLILHLGDAGRSLRSFCDKSSPRDYISICNYFFLHMDVRRSLHSLLKRAQSRVTRNIKNRQVHRHTHATVLSSYALVFTGRDLSRCTTHVILINAGAAHKYAVYAKSELQLFHWPIFILVRSYI